MLTTELLKILAKSHTYDQWHKASGLSNEEASSYWIKFRWAPTKEDKEFIRKYEELNNSQNS